jgi:hypothetical protein
MRFLMLGLLGLALAGCELLGLNRNDTADARARWAARGPADYDFTLVRSCFCLFGGAYRIAVRADTIHAVTPLHEGQEVPSPQDFAVFQTLDDLFAIIDNARDADRLKTTYDPEWGFPTEVDIDYNQHAVDDEITYRAEDFTPRSQTVLLKPGKAVALFNTGYTLTFEAVTSDSRCPTDVVCITAGTATIRLLLKPPPFTRPPDLLLEMEPGKTTEAASYRFTFLDLLPAPVSTRSIRPADYRARLRIERLDEPDA